MEIKYTIRIKEERNPPTFKEELAKGVVATQMFNNSSIVALAGNVLRLGDVAELMLNFRTKLYGSFCQTAVTCWAVYQ